MVLIDKTVSLGNFVFNFRVHRGELAENGVVIFMPSAKSEAVKSHYPYYPRHTWANLLDRYCVVYVGNPCDRLVCDFAPGSWFLNGATSALPSLADILIDLVGVGRNILVYGSSMGGYAGVILGSLIGASHVIAECPQIDLPKYPPFKALLTDYLPGSIHETPWLNVFNFLMFMVLKMG
jgi:hypothetical protein